MDVLIVSIVAWAIAQSIKGITSLVEDKRFIFEKFISPGGMPSSHSSTVCALATSVAIVEGIMSVTFAITFILAFIVMYDAAGLRRSVGDQAVVLNRITQHLRERHSISYFEEDLRELVGHSTFQVIIGAGLGVGISFIWFFWLARY
jgi:uncharacterized protein